VDSVGTCVQCSKYVDVSLERKIIGPLSVATLIDDRRDVRGSNRNSNGLRAKMVARSQMPRRLKFLDGIHYRHNDVM
jgi:hypothetical protein